MKISLPFTPPSLNMLFPTNRQGRRFKSQRYKTFIEEFGLHIPKSTENFLNGDLCMEINFYFADKRQHDIDNFSKAILDTLVAYGIIGDDNQVTKLHLEKYYQKDKPETIIEIKTI